MSENSIIETLRDRVKGLFASGEVSQNALAKTLGVEQASLSRFVNGKSGISGEAFVKLLTYMNGTILYNDSPTMRGMGKFSSVEPVIGDDLPTIPVFLEAGAGLPVELWQTIPSKVIPILPQYYRRDVRAIEVTGDSMESTIKKGAIVGVVPLESDLVEGGIYLVRRPPFGLVVKRVRADSDGRIILHSDNPTYAPQPIPFEGYEDIIIGQVIWCWQSI